MKLAGTSSCFATLASPFSGLSASILSDAASTSQPMRRRVFAAAGPEPLAPAPASSPLSSRLRFAGARPRGGRFAVAGCDAPACARATRLAGKADDAADASRREPEADVGCGRCSSREEAGPCGGPPVPEIRVIAGESRKDPTLSACRVAHRGCRRNIKRASENRSSSTRRQAHIIATGKDRPAISAGFSVMWLVTTERFSRGSRGNASRSALHRPRSY